jgi:pimeloyl-ACP methyl ester carboxylesterase
VKLHLGKLINATHRALSYSASGAAAVAVIVFVIYLNNRADLQVWHLAELVEEFTANSGVETFTDYRALEERLFNQLDELVYAKITPDQQLAINRYNHGSLSDPERWSPNWNCSFTLSAESPRAAVLLLHGMSDSPDSLHHLGERLHSAGANVLGLRMHGHGTAPSGLVELTLQDMAAAVRYLAEQADGLPIYIIGYSTGATLAVNYALASLEDETLPPIKRGQRLGQHAPTDSEIGLSWPEGLYSLAHVALPFPPRDPLYGGQPEG